MSPRMERGGGVLETDNNLRDIQNQLLSAVTYSIGGNSGLVNLASIGVNMNTDGTLSVDSGTLAERPEQQLRGGTKFAAGRFRRGHSF